MTVRECYAAFGGDLDEALSRLLTEARVEKYLKKFVLGTDYTDLLREIEAKNWENAFRHSHNLKGMALNLAMTRLAASGSALCETMRHGAPTVDITPLLQQVKEDYTCTEQAIAQLG